MSQYFEIHYKPETPLAGSRLKTASLGLVVLKSANHLRGVLIRWTVVGAAELVHNGFTDVPDAVPDDRGGDEVAGYLGGGQHSEEEAVESAEDVVRGRGGPFGVGESTRRHVQRLCMVRERVRKRLKTRIVWERNVNNVCNNPLYIVFIAKTKAG